MKAETTVFLLCFLSGIFLPVINAKPSPELLRDLLALEKYLEKKEGADGDAGQNEDQSKVDTVVDPIEGSGQENKPKDEGNTPEGPSPSGSGDGVNQEDTNGKPTDQHEAPPEDEVPPKNAEEGSGVNDQEGEKPQQINNQEGQVEREREKLFDNFADIIEKVKNLVDDLVSLSDGFRKQFLKADIKFKDLKEKDEQTKEKTREQLGQLESAVDGFKIAIGLKDTPEKKSVRENAPARRSQLSDTEFLNMVQSLLANN